MTTLAKMKARIADDLARDDLAAQIANAIGDAIDAYQNDRFLFSETRALTFNTVPGQDFYSASAIPAIGLIRKIDQMTLTQGTTIWPVDPRPPKDLETLTAANGQPSDFAYFAQQIRLYPTPDAAYPIRLIGAFSVAAPADDNETGNAWMTTAERLIRCRAKLEIFAHVINDFDRAQVMSGAAEDAYAKLKTSFNQTTGSGCIAPTQF